jgi:hypothetical protein
VDHHELAEPFDSTDSSGIFFVVFHFRVGDGGFVVQQKHHRPPGNERLQKIASRVRAVKGFGGFMMIHEKISEEAPFSCLQGSTPRCPSKSRTTIQAGFDCMFSFGF